MGGLAAGGDESLGAASSGGGACGESPQYAALEISSLAGWVDVYPDTSRRIGVIDPFLREMHIGVGCALENLLLAAETAGYRWSFDKPASSGDGELQPVVHVLLKEGTRRPSDLYAAIPRRHTNRGPYATGKDMDPRTIEGLTGVKNSDAELRVFWFRKPEEKQAFGDLVITRHRSNHYGPGTIQ